MKRKWDDKERKDGDKKVEMRIGEVAKSRDGEEEEMRRIEEGEKRKDE